MWSGFFMGKTRDFLKQGIFALVFVTIGLIGGYIFFGDPADNISLKPGLMGTVNVAEGSKINIGLQEKGQYRSIEARSLYTLCGHSELLHLGDLSGMTPEQMETNFPREQGWEIADNGEKLVVTKKINALCPEDEKKRHLGRFGQYVAVIKGPPGIDGGIIEVTDIELSSLPEDFRKQAEKGILDFSSAQNLLEALDSLDEIME
jgi:hypothetical protein